MISSAFTTVESRCAITKVVRPFDDAVERVLDFALGKAVERRGRLVQHQNGRRFQHRAGDGDALLFAAGKFEPALADLRVVAHRERADEAVDARRLRRLSQFDVARAVAAVAQIIGQRIVEQHGVLRHHAGRIRKAMGEVRLGIDNRSEKGRKTRPPKFAPAGQSTQMIVGVDAATDGEILTRSAALYGGYKLRRVYYSAFSPIPDATARLPLQRPPMMREHRLYQADWLMRFYGFEREEIAGVADNLDLAIDPKLSWALRHRDQFPIDVNRADRETLLRTPGLGVKSVDRMIRLRRLKRLRLEDVQRLCRGMEKVKPFIVADDWSPGALSDAEHPLTHTPEPAVQLSLF